MASADQQLSAHLPAPKTFAPSREDVLSTLAFFFGDPATPEKLKDYSEHHAMTYHFPGTRLNAQFNALCPLSPPTRDSLRSFCPRVADAFYGQNNKIRETLNNLILKSPQEWQTGIALPFVRIQGTVS